MSDNLPNDFNASNAAQNLQGASNTVPSLPDRRISLRLTRPAEPIQFFTLPERSRGANRRGRASRLNNPTPRSITPLTAPLPEGSQPGAQEPAESGSTSPLSASPEVPRDNETPAVNERPPERQADNLIFYDGTASEFLNHGQPLTGLLENCGNNASYNANPFQSPEPLPSQQEQFSFNRNALRGLQHTNLNFPASFGSATTGAQGEYPNQSCFDNQSSQPLPFETTVHQPAGITWQPPYQPNNAAYSNFFASPEAQAVIYQYETRFTALQQQLEQTVRNAENRIQHLTPPAAAPADEGAATAQQERNQRVQQSLFGPQPFMAIREGPTVGTETRSLQRIWPQIDKEEANRHLKLLVPFDPQTADLSIADYWAWNSVFGPSLLQHEDYMATYLLTRLIPPIFTEQVLQSHSTRIPRFSITVVTRLYGQEVYSLLNSNPIKIADSLKIGKDKIKTSGELFQRVVDLHFCRSDRPLPIIFCYDLVVAIGYHQSLGQRALFLQTVAARYPGIQQAADTVKGLASKIRPQRQQSFASQNLPISADDCEEFAEWLLTIAEVQPIKYPSEKIFDKRPDKRDLPPRKEGFKPNPTPPQKKAKTQHFIFRTAEASPAPIMQVQSVAPTANQRESPSVNPPNRDPEAKCELHPSANHRNRECYAQHPELRQSKDSKNPKKPSEIPADYPGEYKCPVHTEANHKWRECRRNPVNIASSTSSQPPQPARNIALRSPEVVASPQTSRNQPNTITVPIASDLQITECNTNHLQNINSNILSMSSVCRIRCSHRNLVRVDQIDGLLPAERPLNDNSLYSLIPFVNKEPLLRVYLNDQLFKVLGDSGAEISLIPNNVINLLLPAERYLLKHPVLCQPFNTNEQNIQPDDRNTRLTEIFILTVKFGSFQFLFPFFIFPGTMDTPIIGRDFLRHTSLSIHCTEDCFKYLTNHKLPLYHSPLMPAAASAYIVNSSSIVTDAELDDPCILTAMQWRMPSGCIKCTTVHNYNLLPFETTSVIIQPMTKPLRPQVVYQVGLIPSAQRHSMLQLADKYFHCNSQSPVDLLEVTVFPLVALELSKGEHVIWMLPLPKVAISSSLSSFHETEFPLLSKFIPKPFLPDFPLPVNNEDYHFPDYSDEEYRTAASQIGQFLCFQDNQRFLQPRPGLLIRAGTSDLSDAHLVLTAKALAALPEGVWYQEHPDRLPGIPESDVVIPVPLSTTKPIYIKPRRLNPIVATAVQNQLQQEVKLGLIEPCRSSYASPIVVVRKPDGKLRICTDLREINKIVVADRYPLPLIEDVLTKPSGCKYLTILDLTMGFQQLYLHPSDRQKLAFITPDGHYQHNRMPYGFVNGPAAFQREYDTTLGSLTMYARPYLDDLVICDRDNHRRHDAKLQTILFNCYRRGLAVHANKSKILGTEVILLGMIVNGEGIQPLLKDGVFSKLKERKHTTLQHLQQTMGTLLWYRRFIPSFSFYVKPILNAIKDLTSTSTVNPHLDAVCLPVIIHIEELLQQQSVLSHPLPFCPKSIYIVAGISAFATTLYQLPSANKKETLEHWSKIWPLNTRSYTEEERYALAVRETIERFRSIIQYSTTILIFTPSVTFTTLTKNCSFWNTRVAKFLFVSTTLPIEFRTELSPMLPILNDDDSEPLSHEHKGLIHQEIATFFRITPADVESLPKVFTDGSCLTIKNHRFAGIGVFWSEDSKHNLSKACIIPPFTNNRAELEAILAAVTQANQLRITKLLIYSDSQNSVNVLNSLHASQLKGIPISELPGYKGASKSLANLDLLRLILQQLVTVNVFFLHVPRLLNEPADALSRLYWASHEKVEQNDLPEEVNKETLQEEDEELSDEIIDEELPESVEKILQITSTPYIEKRNPFSSTIHHPSFSFRHHQIFAAELREPGSVPDKTEIQLMHDDGISIPAVPFLDSRHYLKIISKIPVAQKEDHEINLLREALLVQHPAGLPATMGNFYPMAFIAPESQIIWVRVKEVDKILIPKLLQLPLIELMHSSPQFGSHCGIAPTLKLIKRLFIWAKMKEQVTTYCKQCQVCISTKQSRTKVPGALVPIPIVTKTFYRLHVDSIVGLPMTSPPGKFTYVLVIIDAFTKFLIAYPLSSIQAPQIVRCLSNIFTLFGAPITLVSDNGTEFKNKIVTDFLASWGVVQKFITSHNPQANGQAESAVKIIVEKLKANLRHAASIRPDSKYLKSSWAVALPQLVYSYNITPQLKLGASPYEMLFGRLPPMLSKEAITESADWGDISTLYYNKLQNVLTAYHQQAEFRLFRHQLLMKKVFDKNRPRFDLHPGDFIYIGPTYSALSKKLSPTFEGPFRVEKVQKAPGTDEVTGACVNIGNLIRPVYRWFPRYRIRPVGNINPSIQWNINICHLL